MRSAQLVDGASQTLGRSLARAWMAVRSAAVRAAGQFLGEPLVVRLQPAGFGERGLPVGFQLPGHQPVFRFG